MVAEPAETPVASPLPLTLATLVDEEVQLARDVAFIAPLVYVAVAVNWTFSPAVTDLDEGVTFRETSWGSVTVMVRVADISPTWAVITASPGFSVVMFPLPSTDATEGSEDDHETVEVMSAWESSL